MNKIFKFFCTCLAVCGIAAAATSCSDDNDPTFLDEVKVSQSIISFEPKGGDVTVSVTAVADWTIGSSDKEGMPDWLTISPANGGAGTTEVTFTAPEATESRTANIYIECAGKKQLLTVQQVTEKVELPIVPIKTVLEGPDGNYRVKGACVANPDNQYGNWYIEDETGTVQVYGTLDKKGNKGAYPISGANGWGFEVGDIITIEGAVTTYKGAKEFVDVTVIAIEKSLIKVDSFDVAELPIEGGVAKAAIVCKGNGISVDVPAEAQSWLSIISIDTQNGIVSFKAAPNAGGDRSADLTFKTTDASGKVYTASATLVQKGSIQEVNVAAFLAAEVGDAQYRLTGVITELYASDKQGQSFYIQDYSGQTLVYGAAGFKESGAKVGDVVTVVGKRGDYKGTAQMTGGTFEALKYAVTTVSIAEFLDKPVDANTYYMITGEVKEIANAAFGNVTLKDGDAEIYCFGCYPGWGATGDNRKGLFDKLGVAVGDKLTIIGVRGEHSGKPQMANGFCFAYEKAQEAGAPGTLENPFTTAQAIEHIKNGGNDNVYVKGKISKVVNEFNAEKGYGTFWMSEDGNFNDDLSKDFEAYRVYWFGDNAKWTEGEAQPAVGDEVIIYGKLASFKDKNTGDVTYETSQYKAWIYSLNGKTK